MPIETPQVFYTVTGEIALDRQRAARGGAAVRRRGRGRDRPFAPSARERSDRASRLQPSLTAAIAARWISLDPKSLEAHRAAAQAALALGRIAESARAISYRAVELAARHGRGIRAISRSSSSASDNVFGARQAGGSAGGVISRVPAAALRLQGFAALRADDPAAGGRQISRGRSRSCRRQRAASLQRRGAPRAPQGLWRARILSGDAQEPLAQSRALAEHDATPANILDYALLLLAAHRNEAAIAQLETLARDPESQPVALRLLGLVEFQDGELDAAGRRLHRALNHGQVRR